MTPTSRPRKRSSGWLACVGWLAAPTTARAEPGSVERAFSASLEYVAPAICPRADDFEAIVARRLGFEPFSEHAAEHVSILISAHEQELAGRIEWRDANGNWAGDQAFPPRHEDCAELARAMAFALAVQIQLLAASQPPERSDPAPGNGDEIAHAAEHQKQSSAPSDAATRREATIPADAPEPKAGAGARWAFALGAGVALGFGLSSSTLPLVRVFGTARRGFMSLELAGELSTKTSTERADGAGFTQRLLLASGAACGSSGPFSACVLAKGGVVDVRGQDIDVPESSSAGLFQAGLRLGARERLGRLFFAQRLEGLLNVTRWTVRLDRTPVWTAPPLAGAVGLDLGVLFE